METILEVVRIEQIIREAEVGVNYSIRSPEDGAKIASRFIGRDDREVFKSAILNNAASVIVAHQHPSGDITNEDINVTKRLVEAGRLLGIGVLDHLVVNSDNSFTSLKERGYI
ncbi:JAB domain-containing protein [Bacillus sp. FSL R10-2780]|uniref:JAB domain-containing protein n=1 Tax=Bacillus sp. FSL R10-2780 TaxID=2954660 RepID=UPI0030FC79EE